MRTERELDLWLRSLKCSEPKKPGMYLHLYHGRTDPTADMEDWGEEGPYFGPLKEVMITYLSAIRLVGLDGRDTEPLTTGSLLGFYDDMIYYSGVYYGDWSVLYHAG